jgi:hypothetical protein
MGVTSIDQLSHKYVCRAEPVIQPHEMSMWANMPTPQGPGGRIL